MLRSEPRKTATSDIAGGTSSPATNSAMRSGVCFSRAISSLIAGSAPVISPANSATTANIATSSKIFTAKKPSANPTTAPTATGSKNRAHFLNCPNKLPIA